MKNWVLLLFCLFSIAGRIMGQNLSGLKDEIESYLNLLHTNPEQISMVENRLSFELKDSTSFALLKTQVLKRLEENPDETAFAEILSWDFIQQREFSKALIQEMALDRRTKAEGYRLLNLGRICIHNKAYSIASQAFTYIINLIPQSKYYRIAKRERLNSKESEIFETSFQKSDFNELYSFYKDYLAEFKQGDDANNVKLNLAKLDIQYLDKLDEADILIQEIIKSPEASNLFKAQSKMELAKLNILKGKVWEAALLLGQIHQEFKEEPLGQEALFESSKIYYYTGDFTLAKSELDVLKTATTDLTSNDAIDLSLLIQKNLEEDSTGKALKEFAHSELLVYQHKYGEAEKALDSILVKYPKNALKDDILMSRYRIHFSEHQYDLAAQNLQAVLDQFPEGIWADDALFLLAEMNENQFKQIQKAKMLYEKLFLNYPGSFFAGESRKRFRNLRGDSIN